jgi:hypothetical protein
MSGSRIDVIGRSGFEGGYWWGSCKPEHRASTPVWRAVTMAPRHPETTFTVTFRAPAGSDGIRELRAVLKFALRRFRLRAISSCESTPQTQDEKLLTVTSADGRKATKGDGDIDKRF